MLTIALLFAAALPQAPGSAADEAKARADLGHAARHLDELLLHADRVRDHARSALELARSTEATANQVDRARLAKLAADLGAQLTSLQAAIETHSEAIRNLRLAVTAEIPPPAAGSVPWFRDRLQAARKLPSFAETVRLLRPLESELEAASVRSKPGAEALLGHVRYVLGDALRESALQANSEKQTALSIGLLHDATKQLEAVMACPDSTDTSEASSLHAAALRRRVEIAASLYLAHAELARRQPGEAANAKRYRDQAESAFTQLRKGFPDATLPDGRRVVDVTRETVERLRANQGR